MLSIKTYVCVYAFHYLISLACSFCASSPRLICARRAICPRLGLDGGFWCLCSIESGVCLCWNYRLRPVHEIYFSYWCAWPKVVIFSRKILLVLYQSNFIATIQNQKTLNAISASPFREMNNLRCFTRRPYWRQPSNT